MAKLRSWYEITAQDEGEAEILIYDEIGIWGITARDFVQRLDELGERARLTVRIDSPGGDVFGGVAIYNALRRNGAEVVVRVDGLAASAASFIAMAGDQVVMPENTMMMIHDPRAIVIGGAEDMRRMAETLEKIVDSIASMYEAKSGLSRDEIVTMMAEETWLSAAEAVERGLADEMVETVEIAARFDLSKFEHPPSGYPARTAGLPSRAVAAQWLSAKEIRAILAAQPGRIVASAAVEQSEEAEMDLKDLNMKTLRAQRPDLVDELEKPATEAIETATAQAREEATTAERERVAGIRALSLPGYEALVEEMIADGRTTPDQAGKRLVEAQKARAQAVLDGQRASDPEPADPTRQPEALPRPAAGAVQVGDSLEDPTQRRETIALAIKARCLGTAPEERARPFIHMSCVDLAREFLPNRGAGLRYDQVIENALTTTDFPHTLGAGMDKILLSRYEEYPTTYMFVSRPMSLSDFKQKKLIRFGDFPELKEVQEDGEYTYGAPGEHPEYIQLRTWGRLLSISRQALINDDLGAFDDFGVMAAEAVRRFENKTVWAVVTTNANMSDGNALFSSQHGNLAASGAAPSAATIGAGKAAMRKQKSIDGETINLEPATIVVPSDLETAVEQLLSDLIVPTTPSELTPRSQRQLAQVTEPLLDADSITAWYLSANINRRAGLVYANLRGVNGPETFTDDHFTRDGVTIKVRRDFASAAEDWRGLYKNPGA